MGNNESQGQNTGAVPEANGSSKAVKNGAKTAQEENTDETAKKEYEDMKDRFMRLAAEFDNYKKRVTAELAKSKSIGKAEIMKKLLPVLDEFELAILSAQETKDEGFAKGVKMVYTNMLSVLRAEGLREIDASGKYNPYEHEIILTRESDEAPGRVIEVVKKGYKFEDIMIRPASVIISAERSTGATADENKAPGKNDEAQGGESSTKK
ncbi:MAG: nucleotide exchange factor GrpE [Candidatus Marsarchaeota archaeon]|nr:nucleotide exchange factor GrpE [Candidatus Marsarchaeota archaeon]